jgi:hypothetical protein
MATSTPNQEESIIIGSYNTSYPLDLHSDLLHPGLSESAAIVQKAIVLSGTTTADTIAADTAAADTTAADTTAADTTAAAAATTDTTAAAAAAAATFNNLITFDTNITPSTTMPTDVNNNHNKLGKFRLNLADCITEHIQKRLLDKNNKPDVYMLIEQSIHVDDTNMAYYGWGNNGNIDLAKYDLTKNNPTIPNKNYGILRRINNINKDNDNLLFDCCTGSADKIQTETRQQFNIMYDNVVNTSMRGVAEGIAIITNNTKFPLNNMLKWNRNKLPIPQKLGYSGKDEAGKDKVFFYSDDLGQIIENANILLDNSDDKTTYNVIEQKYYIKKGGLISDMGRPIMLTACLTNQNLHIFIAVHNLNLPQLRAIPAALFKQYTKDLINDNANKTQIATNFRNIIEADYPKLAELKHDKVSLKTAICKSLREGMGKFVTSAFTPLVIADSIVGIETVKVYMGGDFNDPEKLLLTQLTENGIDFEINTQKYSAKFNFADFGKTCCANADSVKGPTKADTLGGINTDTIFRINGIPNPDKNKDNKFKYPTDFIKGENFNFEGDTVSFAIATTDTSTTKSVPPATLLQGNGDKFTIPQPEYKYTNNTNNTIQKVMPSDHYAVMAQFKYQNQGGNRRNYVKNTGRNALSFAKGVRGIKRYNVTRRLDQKKTRTISHNKNTNKYKKSCNEVRTKKKRRTSRKL